MKVYFTKKFWKQYYKLSKSAQVRFGERIKILLNEPESSIIKLHPLKGKYVGYWSISVTGDIRALYRADSTTNITFTHIGTHSQLY